MAVNASSGKRIRRRIAGIIFSILSAAVLSYLALSLLSGDFTDLTQLARIFSGQSEYAGELNFATGNNKVFADLGDGFVSMGSLGVQVLSYDGNETLRDAFGAKKPAVTASGGRAAAYDIGGTVLRVFDSREILFALETKNPVISASINKNGWFCLCTQESGVYKSTVTVYNNKGNSVYKFPSGSGYILHAVLSGDNRNMAVLMLTENGSRIRFFNLSSEDPGAYFDLDGGLIIDIRYLPNGNVLAISEESLITVEKNGAAEVLYDFAGKNLRGYAEDDGIIALYLLDYGVGSRGRLVTLNIKGEILGELQLGREVTALSIKEKTVASLTSDGLTLYDTELTEYPLEGDIDAGDARRVIALNNGVFAAGEYSARVVQIGE